VEASETPNAERIGAQHAQGKLTAPERLSILLDAGSFESFACAPSIASGDQSVIVGTGTIHGRRVYVAARDYTIQKGALSASHAAKIAALQTQAIAAPAPLIYLFDSDGLRREDAAAMLAASTDMTRLAVKASGLIPQISLVMGPCAGGDAILAAMTDFIFMVEETSSLFVTGPEIVNRLTGLNVTKETLGGSAFHSMASGLADAVFTDDVSALLQLRRFVDFLPASNQDFDLKRPSFDDAGRLEASLDSLVPDDLAVPYDVKELLLKIADEGDVFETQAAYAANIITGFARLQGRTAGVIANQPSVLGGALDANACRKAARFIRFCDSFNIPLVTFVDTPGFLPGADQEEKALAAQAAKLFAAFTEADVPKVSVILGQAFGPAFATMASKQDGNWAFAWPSARIGLMNAEDAIVSLEEAKTTGLIDAVIRPSETRSHILAALASPSKKPLVSPAKKHNNMPL
jgi:propionyl-CoA carboxylase beta chain